MNDDLSAALAHLRLFRSTLSAGVVVDEVSGLTAADLDLIMDAIAPHVDLEPGGSLTADDLGDAA